MAQVDKQLMEKGYKEVDKRRMAEEDKAPTNTCAT